MSERHYVQIKWSIESMADKPMPFSATKSQIYQRMKLVEKDAQDMLERFMKLQQHIQDAVQDVLL